MPLAVRRVKGVATINLQSKPEIRPGQRVALLLGEQEIAAADRKAQSNQTSFSVPSSVAGGTYVTRLRVDGVDSPVIDWSQTPPAFDASQKVTISP
jgi:hypothetical protein